VDVLLEVQDVKVPAEEVSDQDVKVLVAEVSEATEIQPQEKEEVLEATETHLLQKEKVVLEVLLQELKEEVQTELQDVLKALVIHQDQEDQEETNKSIS
jgi:hypothetical protein